MPRAGADGRLHDFEAMIAHASDADCSAFRCISRDGKFERLYVLFLS